MSGISDDRIERAARAMARESHLMDIEGMGQQPTKADMKVAEDHFWHDFELTARAALEADAPSISDDHKATALAKNICQQFATGPDEYYDKLAWVESRIAAALASAEARGKAEGRVEGMKEAAGICRHHAIQCSQDAANYRGGSNPNAIRLANSALHAKDAAAIDARLASLEAQEVRG